VPYTYKHGDRPLAGYTVQRAIGRGGFGEVYYAVADSGKQVALKYLRENPEVELRGIGHVLNLKSPHLITIYDVKQNENGDWFVIMEYVTGPSLRELLLAEPAGMSPAKVAFLLRGIVAGLSYLHERGIVHRDLKPANIFYDDGYVKIGDYGLSKHISVSQHSGQTVSVGTVHYMAPEIGSGSYTRAIDIYALGVILYEMLTGRLPFTGSSMGEVLMRHLRDNPDLTGVPAPFAAVITKALAKDPNHRYASAEELLAAVMESDELCQEVEGFDASRLTLVPRVPEASDARTVTSPQPIRPTLDVRAGPIPEVGAPPDLPPVVRRKLDRLSRKAEAKLAKAEAKIARIQQKWGQRAAEPHISGGAPAGAIPRRRSQLAVLTVIAVAVGSALGLLHGDGRYGADKALALVFFIVGGVAGPLAAHLSVLPRAVAYNPLLVRLVYAALAGLAMLPAYNIARGSQAGELHRLIFVPMLMVAICDWHSRIERGRRGEARGRVVFWPAIIGLAGAGVAGADGYEWVSAVVCTTIALLTPAAAALWPVAKAGDLPVAGVGPQRPAAPVVLPSGLAAAPPNAPTLPRGEPVEGGLQADAGGETARPSFAGKGTHAGTAFLGKMLLLIGLVLALGPGLRWVPYAALVSSERENVHGPWFWRLESFVELVSAPRVSRVAIASAMLVVGTIALVAARRGQGWGHALRGLVGCTLLVGGAVWAGIMAWDISQLVGDGPRKALLELATQEWELLAVAVGATLLGLVALAWPARRGGYTT